MMEKSFVIAAFPSGHRARLDWLKKMAFKLNAGTCFINK